MKSCYRSLLIPLAGLGLSNWAYGAESLSTNRVDPSTLNGKIMASYQGWFMTPDDGSGAGWRHWAGSTPNTSNVTFDLWPDWREYDVSERFGRPVPQDPAMSLAVATQYVTLGSTCSARVPTRAQIPKCGAARGGAKHTSNWLAPRLSDNVTLY